MLQMDLSCIKRYFLIIQKEQKLYRNSDLHKEMNNISNE